MQVQDKKLYHFHTKDIYNDIWQVGNTFVVDDNYNSDLTELVKTFTPAINVYTKDGSYKESFDNFLEGYLDEEEFKTIDRDLAMKMIKTTIGIIQNANICRREYLLEKYRQKYYPNIISRYHTLWLTDENSLEYWKKIFKDEKKLLLFELQVTGEIFKSSDEFIPSKHLNMEEMYKASEKYWNPDFSNEKANKKTEYLFQGKVKILKKL